VTLPYSSRYEWYTSFFGTGIAGISRRMGAATSFGGSGQIRAVGPTIASQRTDHSEGSVLAEAEARFAAACSSEGGLELASDRARRRVERIDIISRMLSMMEKTV
jgi:hypothetical protein